MRASNQLLRIQEATTAADGIGGQTVTWATAFDWWAAQASQTAQEQEQRLGRLASVALVTFQGRWDSRLRTTHRAIGPDGTIYNVRSIENVGGLNRTMRVVCESGVTT